MRTCPYTFPDDGRDYEVRYTCGGRNHRDQKDGPALVRVGLRYVEERFLWNGKLHRVGGPAYTTWSRQTGRMVDESYYFHGIKHRDPSEGPAMRLWDKGVLHYEEYKFLGEQYRDPADGPAKCSYDKQTGELVRSWTATKRDLTKARAKLERIGLVQGRRMPPKYRGPRGLDFGS